MNYAAIDCGTNSIRLLVVDRSGKRLREEQCITRLGEGVHHNRSLTDAAIERSIGVLAEYRALLDLHEVVGVRAVATSALRDAVDARRFVEPAGRVLGVEVEVITGAEEARLSFSGATAHRDRGNTYLVVDVGGGSTELVLGVASDIEFAHSFDLGAVRLTEMFLGSDPPAVDELERTRTFIADHLLRSELPALLPGRGVELIAVDGTATTLAMLDLGIDEFDSRKVEGHQMTAGRVSALHRELAAVSADERTSPVLPRGRAEVIVGGTSVLATLLEVLRIERVEVSTCDIMTGITASLHTGA